MIDALDLSAPAALGVLAAFFAGGLMKGGLGFGLPLVTISITPFFVPVDLAIALNAAVLPFVNMLQVWQAGTLGETLRRYWPLILMLSLTMPIGVLLGLAVSAEGLTLALGLAITAFTLFQWVNPRLVLPQRLERPIGAGVGVVAGICGGLTSINGPFFVLYLVGLGVERRVMMSALGVFFLLTGVLLSGSFAAVGLLDGPRLLAALACLLPAFAGMAAGNRLARRVPQEAFRRIVLSGLLLLGLNITLRGLTG
ncbi:MAG: sulfite exporter TauE/SafE family protein [Pseudomonadota bacterium]